MSRVFCALFLFLFIFPNICNAQLSDNEEITEEELLFMEIPLVITASKKEQPITESPAAVTVLTSKDIKESGASNIPDLLRSVSGVHVMTKSARDQQVSIRGFNENLNNKLLVLIDGRSVYWDGFGNVFWQMFPIDLDEIDRIEIIKSPVSSLYGANAFSGIISIISKSPDKLPGAGLTLTGGEGDSLGFSLIHSAMAGKVDYKISIGWNVTDEWESDDDAGEIRKGNFLLRYKENEKSEVSLSGGRVSFEDAAIFPNERSGLTQIKGDFDYLKLDYEYSDFKIHTYYKNEDINSTALMSGNDITLSTSTYDTELQYSHDFDKEFSLAGEKHSVIAGAGYRHYRVDKNRIIPDTSNQDLWSLFFEDHIGITEKVRFTAGARYDIHPLADSHFSPRLSLSYTPVRDHVFRLSFTKAFRNPTFIDSYQYTESEKLTEIMPGTEIPFKVSAGGSKDLDSEGITSYEFGYFSRWSGRVSTNLNLFYNKYKDLFTYDTFVYFNYYDANELYPGSPPDTIPKEMQLEFIAKNGEQARGIGGEFDINVSIYKWLSLYANYSYLEITDKKDDPYTTIIDEHDRERRENPENKVNAGIKMRFKNDLFVNFYMHWVDKTENHVFDIEGAEYIIKTEDYAIFNLSLNYPFLKDKGDISLSAFNIFNNEHYEYSIFYDDRSKEIGSKFTAILRYRF